MVNRVATPASDTVLSDRYRLCERLGVGGMGEVWEAEDILLERRVAVKLVGDANRHDDSFMARFKREAQTAARLAHPNLATVFDYGESDEGVYLVMELLDGETLGERLQRGPLPPAEAAEVVAQAADGLAAAHRAGIVHRDVKPSNLMLTAGGVKVMDFGIAQGLGDSLTATGLVVGTASYLAPERVRGETSGPEADVYGLGAVLYEAVTATRAFDGATVAEAAMAHLHREPPDLAELDPSVPPALARACRTALAKEPSARPRAADLAAELRDGAPAKAPPTATSVFSLDTTAAASPTAAETPPVITEPPQARPTEPRSPSDEPRRRPWLLVAAVIALLAVAGAAFALTRGDDEPGGRTITAAEETTPTDQPDTGAQAAETEPSPTTPPPASETDGSSGELEDAALGYIEAVDGGNLDAAWALTSPAFQSAQDRSSWEGFWGGFESVEVAGEPRVDEEAGTVVVPLSFDGRTEDYELTFTRGSDGTWLVDGPVGS